MTNTTYNIVAPATGKCVPIEAVHNNTFSSKTLGDGVAIFSTDGKVVAPCDGIISNVSASSHAVTVLDTASDLELMLCADIDTSAPEVTFCVQPGQFVKAGETLFTCDVTALNARGCSVSFPCIITNAPFSKITVVSGDAVCGQTDVMSCECVG